MKKILIVSLVLVVALLAALPAMAMIADNYTPDNNFPSDKPSAGRSLDSSFGTPGKAEYCKKSGHRDCDDGKDHKDKDEHGNGKDHKKDKDRDGNDGRKNNGDR